MKKTTCEQYNETLANIFYIFVMSCLKVICCWALIFIFKLRFPPGVSIATVLKLGNILAETLFPANVWPCFPRRANTRKECFRNKNHTWET